MQSMSQDSSMAHTGVIERRDNNVSKEMIRVEQATQAILCNDVIVNKVLLQCVFS